jgi:arabinogalactan endo-1,4-beta-galactosidase
VSHSITEVERLTQERDDAEAHAATLESKYKNVAHKYAIAAVLVHDLMEVIEPVINYNDQSVFAHGPDTFALRAVYNRVLCWKV